MQPKLLEKFRRRLVSLKESVNSQLVKENADQFAFSFFKYIR